MRPYNYENKITWIAGRIVPNLEYMMILSDLRILQKKKHKKHRSGTSSIQVPVNPQWKATVSYKSVFDE
jgi:hypothetical protein